MLRSYRASLLLLSLSLVLTAGIAHAQTDPFNTQGVPTTKVKVVDLKIQNFGFPQSLVELTERFVGTGALDLRNKKFVSFMAPKEGFMDSSGQRVMFKTYGWVLSESHGQTLVVRLDGVVNVAEGSLEAVSVQDGVAAMKGPENPQESPYFAQDKWTTAALLMAAGRPDLAKSVIPAASPQDEISVSVTGKLSFGLLEAATTAYSQDQFYASESAARSARMAVSSLYDLPGLRIRLTENDVSGSPYGQSVFGYDPIWNGSNVSKVQPRATAWLIEQESKRRQKDKATDLDAVMNMPQDKRNEALVKALGENKLAVVEAAIEKQGESIIPALIQEVSGPTHLTQGTKDVAYSYLPAIDLMTTNEAALSMVLMIWKGCPLAEETSLRLDPKNEVIGSFLRETWARQKGMTVAERYVDNVANPVLSNSQVIDSMKVLALPATPDGAVVPLDSGSVSKLTEAVLKRASGVYGSGRISDQNAAADLLVYGCRMGNWSAYLQAMKDLSARLAKQIGTDADYFAKTNVSYTAVGNRSIDPWAELISQRILLGDQSAVGEYEAAVLKTPKYWAGSPGSLMPAWACPDNIQVQNAAKQILDAYDKERPGRAIESLIRPAGGVLTNDWLKSPAIRGYLANLMASDAPYGHLMVLKTGTVLNVSEYTDSWMSSLSNPIDESVVRTGQFDEAVWEHYMLMLAFNDPVRQYSAGWSDEKREAARQKMIADLKNPAYDFTKERQSVDPRVVPLYHPGR